MKFGPMLHQMFSQYAILPFLAITILIIVVWLGWSVGLTNLIQWILFKLKIIKSFTPTFKDDIRKRKRGRMRRNAAM